VCFPAAHARKGQALEKLGRVDDARTHYKQCIKNLKHNSHFKKALQDLEANEMCV
jgi:Flp pilus assembly protein TadD